MFLKEYAPWVLLSPLGSALVSLHLFLIFSGGGEEVLSWCSLLGDSLLSFPLGLQHLPYISGGFVRWTLFVLVLYYISDIFSVISISVL